MKITEITERLRKLKSCLWPWREIARLNHQLMIAVNGLADANRGYEAGLAAGRGEHWYKWLGKVNSHYGPRPIAGDERVLLRKLYDDGMNWRDALSYLNRVERRDDGHWRTDKVGS